MTQIEKLNQISMGWRGSENSIHCNPNAMGGIIDLNFSTKKWFIIFNDSDHVICNIDTFEQAVNIFCDMMKTVDNTNESVYTN